MPTYVFLLYGDESSWADADEATVAASFAAHGAFTEAVAAAGARIVAGEALDPTSHATTVDRSPAGDVVRDGPFVELKEALGGFYVVECADLDAALALARQCPEDHVEVRPVMALPDA